jgi:hypothetical protein
MAVPVYWTIGVCPSFYFLPFCTQVCDSSTLKLRPCELALSLLCTEFQRQCGKEGKGATSAALMGFISELQVT